MKYYYTIKKSGKTRSFKLLAVHDKFFYSIFYQMYFIQANGFLYSR